MFATHDPPALPRLAYASRSWLHDAGSPNETPSTPHNRTLTRAGGVSSPWPVNPRLCHKEPGTARRSPHGPPERRPSARRACVIRSVSDHRGSCTTVSPTGRPWRACVIRSVSDHRGVLLATSERTIESASRPTIGQQRKRNSASIETRR